MMMTDSAYISVPGCHAVVDAFDGFGARVTSCMVMVRIRVRAKVRVRVRIRVKVRVKGYG